MEEKGIFDWYPDKNSTSSLQILMKGDRGCDLEEFKKAWNEQATWDGILKKRIEEARAKEVEERKKKLEEGVTFPTKEQRATLIKEIQEEWAKEEDSSEERATRHNEGKLNWSVLHWPSLEPLVKVLEFGATKYGMENWKKGQDKKQILNSAMRHLISLMNNEEYDLETNLSHAAHIMANCMFYLYELDKENSNGNKEKE